jgi:hypothetical protein
LTQWEVPEGGFDLPDEEFSQKEEPEDVPTEGNLYDPKSKIKVLEPDPSTGRFI